MKQTEAVNLFRAGSFDVYVGSPDQNQDPRDIPVGQLGFLGNPFEKTEDGKPVDKAESLAKYKTYFIERLQSDERFRKAVLSLYGTTLGSATEPEGTHAEFIASYLNEHRAECLTFSEPTPDQLRAMNLKRYR